MGSTSPRATLKYNEDADRRAASRAEPAPGQQCAKAPRGEQCKGGVGPRPLRSTSRQSPRAASSWCGVVGHSRQAVWKLQATLHHHIAEKVGVFAGDPEPNLVSSDTRRTWGDGWAAAFSTGPARVG